MEPRATSPAWRETPAGSSGDIDVVSSAGNDSRSSDRHMNDNASTACNVYWHQSCTTVDHLLNLCEHMYRNTSNIFRDPVTDQVNPLHWKRIMTDEPVGNFIGPFEYMLKIRLSGVDGHEASVSESLDMLRKAGLTNPGDESKLIPFGASDWSAADVEEFGPPYHTRRAALRARPS